jgi:hypothetical protein
MNSPSSAARSLTRLVNNFVAEPPGALTPRLRREPRSELQDARVSLPAMAGRRTCHAHEGRLS